MSVFILSADRAGYALAGELRAAARRGVRVRVLVDGINGRQAHALLEHLDASGVDVRLYKPVNLWSVFFPSYNNVRMHDKMLLVDGEDAVFGGRNIEEGYFGFSKNSYKHFDDLDVRVHGPSARKAASYFATQWGSATAVDVKGRVVHAVGARLDRFASVARRWVDKWRHRAPAAAMTLGESEFVHDLPDRLTKASGGTHDKILRAIDSAERHLVLVTPYLVPTTELWTALAGAVARGVKVEVVTNSYKNNEGILPHSAYEAGFARAAKLGLDIWEHRGRTLHSKAMVIDDKRAFVGSYNLDPRSQNLNLETGVFLTGKGILTEMRHEVRRLRQGAFHVASGGSVLPGKAQSCGWECSLLVRSLGKLVVWSGLVGHL